MVKTYEGKKCRVCGNIYHKSKTVGVPEWNRSSCCSRKCASKLGVEKLGSFPRHLRKRDENGAFFCPRCKRFLPIERYTKSKRTYWGIASWCKDCFRLFRIEWHENPRAHLLSLVKGASKRGREFTLPREWAIKQFEKQNGLCYYTGIQLTTGHGRGRVWSNASIDRKDSSLGYTTGNCVLCCIGFNLMKTDLNLSDMKVMCEAFIRNYREQYGKEV